ncbi:MAG: transposase, partial [Lachnospiraceae bacterium]|nr:transposase [Lachnospiraceae bacterium]
MGQKDMTEKLLEEYNDVFADIYNVLVFKKDVIDENRLRDGTTESVYKAEDGAYREQRRDVMKTYLDEYHMELAFIGIDNQTSVDRYIPVRVLGYDYAKYRRQVDERRFPLLPVVTLVLNMSDRRWGGCKSLADITKVPAEFEP